MTYTKIVQQYGTEYILKCANGQVSYRGNAEGSEYIKVPNIPSWLVKEAMIFQAKCSERESTATVEVPLSFRFVRVNQDCVDVYFAKDLNRIGRITPHGITGELKDPDYAPIVKAARKWAGWLS